MPDNTEKSIPGSENSTYLPDFCDGEVFLRLLLVVQLIAIMFALVSFGGGRLFVHLALISLAMLWVGLTTAALLCLMKRQGWLGDHVRTTVLVFAAAILMTLLVSFLSLGLGGVMSYGPTAHDTVYTLARNLAIVVILVGLALRYFYLRHESLCATFTCATNPICASRCRLRRACRPCRRESVRTFYSIA